MFFESLFQKVGMNLLYFMVSRISFIMIIYLVCDFIFGLTVRRLNKGSIPIEKAQSIYGCEDIESSFKWLKKKFNIPNVQLYIAPSFDVVNAYAIGSLRKKSVTITIGLLEKLKANASSHDQYIDAVKGVLGHEMSHLANGDYLPGLLTSANETANRCISNIIRRFFIIFANLFRFIPYVGRYIYILIIRSYNLLSWVINAFFNWVFMPAYGFLQKWFGRSVEYRCDRESSFAFGGQRMAFALSCLGEGAYFSIFSTHPRTKSRINYVKNEQPRGGIISPNIINTISNFLSVFLVIFVCAYSTEKTDIPGMYEHYLQEVYYPLKIKSEGIMRVFTGY
jgi:Zn-dependent protease with chaperone function